MTARRFAYLAAALTLLSAMGIVGIAYASQHHVCVSENGQLLCEDADTNPVVITVPGGPTETVDAPPADTTIFLPAP